MKKIKNEVIFIQKNDMQAQLKYLTSQKQQKHSLSISLITHNLFHWFRVIYV